MMRYCPMMYQHDLTTTLQNCHKWPLLLIKEDDVEDVNDEDIGTEMNKQVPLEDLNPTKARLNYD